MTAKVALHELLALWTPLFVGICSKGSNEDAEFLQHLLFVTSLAGLRGPANGSTGDPPDPLLHEPDKAQNIEDTAIYQLRWQRYETAAGAAW